MPKGNLVESVFLCKRKKSLSTIPRTKEALCLSAISGLVKRSIQHIKLYAKTITKIPQVSNICHIRHISHYNMHCLNRNRGFENARTLCHKTRHYKRVLAPRKSKKNLVTISQQRISSASFIKKTSDSAIHHTKRCTNSLISTKIMEIFYSWGKTLLKDTFT